MRLLHAADLHLDSQLKGMCRYEGAPDCEPAEATRTALRRVVDYAVRYRVDLVLIAGDIYDADWNDYNTGLFFVQQMALLREAGIPVVIIRGNHDAANRITRHLRLPDTCYVLPHERPDTIVFDALGIAVHGQSFGRQHVTENLAAAYPPPRSGFVNVGLLHTALTGREGHEPYAPCRPEDLLEKGYHYWALGHVHRFEIVNGSEGRAVFSGNTQGRHANETGAKGVVLVELDHAGTPQTTFLATHAIRWEQLVVDASACRTEDDVYEVLEQALLGVVSQSADGDEVLALRVRFTGTTPVDTTLRADRERWIAEARGMAVDVGGGRLWIETVRVETVQPRARSAQSATWKTLLDELIAGVPLSEWQQILAEDEDLRKLRGGIRRRLKRDFDASLEQPQWLEQAVQDARALLQRVLHEQEPGAGLR